MERVEAEKQWRKDRETEKARTSDNIQQEDISQTEEKVAEKKKTKE